MSEYSLNDYSKYRFTRAEETLQEIDVLINNEFWNTAVTRMYYACFYAVSALLVSREIKVSSHTGVRQKFGQLFVKTGIFDKNLAKHYTRLYEKRIKGDYNDFFDYEREEVLLLLPDTIKFVKEIKKILK